MAQESLAIEAIDPWTNPPYSRSVPHSRFKSTPRLIPHIPDQFHILDLNFELGKHAPIGNPQPSTLTPKTVHPTHCCRKNEMPSTMKAWATATEKFTRYLAVLQELRVANDEACKPRKAQEKGGEMKSHPYRPDYALFPPFTLPFLITYLTISLQPTSRALTPQSSLFPNRILD